MQNVLHEVMTELAGTGSITVLGTIVMIIGIMAIITSLIVQGIKEIPGIKSIPTRLVSILIGIVVSVCFMLLAIDFGGLVFRPSFIIIVIFGGFAVGSVASNGWSELKELKDRLIPKFK